MVPFGGEREARGGLPPSPDEIFITSIGTHGMGAAT